MFRAEGRHRNVPILAKPGHLPVWGQGRNHGYSRQSRELALQEPFMTEEAKVHSFS